MTTYTTLNEIRAHSPCAEGWAKLLRHLGKTQADDAPLALVTILDSNGLDDALWCVRACDGIDREARLYAVWCARQVQHLMTDPRSLAALDVAERHANAQATDDELDAAWAAARDAAWVAAWAAASAAARVAASAAAWAAARDAASAAARDAASAAASAAARVAAWAAASAAARDAASAAAWAAASAAARDAASAAAWAAASAAARDAQAAEFRRRFA
jgi:hypothetical protein